MSQRTDFTGAALIRLLARLAGTEVPPSRQSFADRLSQWFSWIDAISLSTALSGNIAAVPSSASAGASAEEADAAHVRRALTASIGLGVPAADAESDFTPYRRHCQSRQQAMEVAIGPLRGRLRAALAGRSPDMARLAALDAVMEQVLGVQEHRLLATLPALLEKHFVRLRDAGGDEWRAVFQRDLQGVLLAELDIRLQPVEGLLAALRTH